MKNDNFQAHPGTFYVQLGTWSDLGVRASAIRFEVFVEEQQVPIAEELDAMDAECLHALAFSHQGVAIATGRLLPDGHIGRMAVKLSERKKGVARRFYKLWLRRHRREVLKRLFWEPNFMPKIFT